MPRVVVVCVALFAFLGVSLLVSPAGALSQVTTTPPPIAAQQPADKVSYCHGTASLINPYNLLTTDVDSIITHGHGSHTGPIFPEQGPGQNNRWGDIIPPFDYDNGQQHFPGLNWPAGSAILEAGCAVHETIQPPVVTKPNINVNVSCQSQMNLDVTFNEAPTLPWTLVVTTVPAGPAPQPITLVDNDSDLMGFHPVIPAAQLPQMSYTWSVDATNAGQTFPVIASGNVVCQTDTTTTTVAASTTTTTKPSTTTTVAASTTTTTKPPTTTTKPSTTTTVAASSTTVAAGSGSTTTVAGVTTTTAVASASGTTTTTSVPPPTSTAPPTGTPPPTAAPAPLDPPPVEALAPGEVLPDPPPRVLAFVVLPGNRIVALAVLRPEQVRALYDELSALRLARTGSNTVALVVVASLSLLIGAALLRLAKRPRRRAA